MGCWVDFEDEAFEDEAVVVDLRGFVAGLVLEDAPPAEEGPATAGDCMRGGLNGSRLRFCGGWRSGGMLDDGTELPRGECSGGREFFKMME